LSENNTLPETLNFSHLIEGLEWHDLEFVLVEKGKCNHPINQNPFEDVGDGRIEEVGIDSSIYIPKFPSTQRLWVEIMGDNPSEFRGVDHPVESVSWFDVQKFFELLNQRTKKHGLIGFHFRLPLEAEWYYTSKAGPDFGDYSYSGSSRYTEVGYLNDNSNWHTWPVKSGKKCNQLGIYDMNGNVYEWCDDLFERNLFENRIASPKLYDRHNFELTSIRVTRGCAWSSDLKYGFENSRSSSYPNLKNSNLGFRIVVEWI
jgi:formylglycine-generating enzyme required for sulfatase activity